MKFQAVHSDPDHRVQSLLHPNNNQSLTEHAHTTLLTFKVTEHIIVQGCTVYSQTNGGLFITNTAAT